MTIRPLLRSCVLILVALFVRAAETAAQSACATESQRLVFKRDPASQRVIPLSRAELADLASRLMAQPRSADSPGLLDCETAEVLRRRGDARADSYYRLAIAADPNNGEFRLLFGDFLRNYRGPEQPLVDAASDQYYAGLATGDVFIRNQIRRSLIALFERDGVALDSRIDEKRPTFFFSTQNVAARTTDDLGNVDAIRSLTSAALFLESPARTGRRLTTAQAAALVRNDWRGGWLERGRARIGTAVLDFSLLRREASQTQVTQFFDPTSRNDVQVLLGGIGVEEVTSLYPLFDVMVRGDFTTGRRTGLIEFRPDDAERSHSFDGHAVLSRFAGPDKINLELGMGRDWITQRTTAPIDRGVNRVSATVRYQVFRPLLGSRPYERPVAARGSEFFVGTAHATEAFAEIDVERRDAFAGFSVKGLPAGGSHSLDVTVQPTFFSSRNRDRLTDAIAELMTHRQVETFATVLYRVVDRENVRNVEDLPPLVFLNVVGVFSIGRAETGPSYFERTRAGAQLDAKLVGRQRGGMTWLLSARYERQRFSRLDRNDNTFLATANLGF